MIQNSLINGKKGVSNDQTSVIRSITFCSLFNSKS